MHQGAARRFRDAEAFQRVGRGMGAHMLVQNIGLVQQLLDLLEGVENLDQTRVMVMERAAMVESA